MDPPSKSSGLGLKVKEVKQKCEWQERCGGGQMWMQEQVSSCVGNAGGKCGRWFQAGEDALDWWTPEDADERLDWRMLGVEDAGVGSWLGLEEMLDWRMLE
jgi:hypothetical protein